MKCEHTHTHTYTHVSLQTDEGAGGVHMREWKRCVTCLWKSVRSAGEGKHTRPQYIPSFTHPSTSFKHTQKPHTSTHTHTQTSIVLTPMHFDLQY